MFPCFSQTSGSPHLLCNGRGVQISEGFFFRLPTTSLCHQFSLLSRSSFFCLKPLFFLYGLKSDFCFPVVVRLSQFIYFATSFLGSVWCSRRGRMPLGVPAARPPKNPWAKASLLGRRPCTAKPIPRRWSRLPKWRRKKMKVWTTNKKQTTNNKQRTNNQQQETNNKNNTI